MILVDFRSVASAAIMVAHAQGGDVVKEGNSTLLGKLRYYNTEFRDEFGEMVLCTDAGSWRYKVFEHYKGQRRASRERLAEAGADQDQKEIFDMIDNFWNTISEFGPYKCIKIRGAEGDDVVASLAMTPGKHITCSADKDISQLTRFPNVKHYDTMKRRIVDNGPSFWHTLVIRGDAGDGVPNILSDDDTFMVKEKRQRQLRQPVVDQIINAHDPEEEILNMKFSGIFSEQVLRNYRRNKRLIDLTQIPKQLQERVVEEFNKEVPKRDMMNLMIKMRTPSNVSRLNDFVPRRSVSIETSLDLF